MEMEMSHGESKHTTIYYILYHILHAYYSTGGENSYVSQGGKKCTFYYKLRYMFIYYLILV